MSEPDGPGERPGFRLSPAVAALIAGGVLILLAVAWYLGGNRNPDQDKLSNPQVAQRADTDRSKRCSTRGTYDLIKRELFSQAAQQRGSDQETFAQIAAAAVLRVDNPVLENVDSGSGALNCSGTFYLDLPPGVVASGARHSLMSDIDYTVQPGAEGGDTVLLRNADSIISALVTMTRVAEPAALSPEGNAVAPEGNVAAAESANAVPGSATAAPGRPSFDCARAGTRGEIAVCGDSGLAALDLNMATQYRRALSTATQPQRQLLQTTRDRFLAYRDRCPNRACMADAYLGRMREIRDIMEGRLTPAR